MQPETLRLRARLIVQRFWQPTSACMTCMPGSLFNLMSIPHWEIALRTGLATSVFVILLSFTPFAKVFRNRYGNAAVIGLLTACGDAFSHRDDYGQGLVEPVITGVVSALLALAASWLFEDRARRLRSVWGRRRLS